MLLIVANWKCNPTISEEAKKLFNSIRRGIKDVKNSEVVICPPFVYLTNLQLTTYNLQLGAQDCFWEEKGAFTGEVSPAMLKDLGVKYVIIGHSERREYFGETNEIINKKLKAAFKAKLKPILCVGETLKEKRERKTDEVLKNQLKTCLKDIPNNSNIVIAYEPVWAIGTGNACQIKEAKEVNLFLKKVSRSFNQLKNWLFLYGGSVNSKNASSYIKEAGFDGLLIGGASLNSKEFIRIIKSITGQT